MLRFLLVLVIFIACSATPLLAAPDHGGGGGGAADPMELRADTAIWAFVVFVGLFAVLYFKAWGPILQGLQKREETIRSSLDEAKKTRAEMELLRANFQKEMAAAQQQIPALLEEARKKGDEAVKLRLDEAAVKIQADQERFRREIEIAKDQAIKQLWDQAAQLATLISAKAIGRSLTDDDHRRLLDEAMQEMSRAAKI
jgi:F-type H+-transporting ATPase subunit b